MWFKFLPSLKCLDKGKIHPIQASLKKSQTKKKFSGIYLSLYFFTNIYLFWQQMSNIITNNQPLLYCRKNQIILKTTTTPSRTMHERLDTADDFKRIRSAFFYINYLKYTNLYYIYFQLATISMVFIIIIQRLSHSTNDFSVISCPLSRD